MSPFKDDFQGYREPATEQILENSRPYLPPEKVSGECVLNIREIICFYYHGADGAIDISPFTCMHGGLGEDLYYGVSKDHNGLPVRSFTCDETQPDIDDNVGIFMDVVAFVQCDDEHRVLQAARYTLPGAHVALVPTGDISVPRGGYAILRFRCSELLG